MIKPEIKIFPTTDKMAKKIIEEFHQVALKHTEQSIQFNIALSGGNTPEKIYRMMARSIDHDTFPWWIVHFFWSDERCVVPDHPASNYGMAFRSLIKYLPIPHENVHRIRGENEPGKEIKRYAQLIKRHIGKNKNHKPQFDWIFLGLGEDGHTASLFPNQHIVEEENGICAYTASPVKGYQRITLTYKLINQASRITFLVTGSSKAAILKKVSGKGRAKYSYPALKINPLSGRIEWFVDNAAAKELEE